eukprot:COSAG02_NODE_54374_length_296_cov_1.025381_1_plen_92_part_10
MPRSGSVLGSVSLNVSVVYACDARVAPRALPRAARAKNANRRSCRIDAHILDREIEPYIRDSEPLYARDVSTDGKLAVVGGRRSADSSHHNL